VVAASKPFSANNRNAEMTNLLRASCVSMSVFPFLTMSPQ